MPINFLGMSYNKIKYKAFIAAILLLVGSTHNSKAQSNMDDAEEMRQSIFSPSVVLLSQTLETISLVKDGIALNLPKIKKEFIPQSWTSDNINTPNIEDQTIARRHERQEMKELSNALGISIRNPIHLDLYREAASWLGTRYKWAGNTKKGTDCSGLTGRLLKEVYDKDVDRSSFIIANNLKEELDTKNLLPGDLVFFTTLRKKRINHVGVYLGEGHFIHASRSGVVVSSLEEGYYARTLKKAGRL